jgi:hypothetical protein
MTSESNGARPEPNVARGMRIALLWIRRHPILSSGLFGCAAALAALVPTLEFSGYCFDQQRFLTDREFLNAAVREAIGRDAVTVALSQGRQLKIDSVPLPRYSSVEEFVEKNPQCCKFTPHNAGDESPLVTFGSRVSGRAARTVVVAYPLNLPDRPAATASLRIVVTNCGYARR